MDEEFIKTTDCLDCLAYATIIVSRVQINNLAKNYSQSEHFYAIQIRQIFILLLFKYK